MLSDLRVIEFGEFVSAPYCSRLFADLGAKVIKVSHLRIKFKVFKVARYNEITRIMRGS